MTDFFKAWIISLSGIIVFGSMCEMILPSGTYKKYIHLAIGLMLVLSVVKPFAETGGEFNAEIPDSVGEYSASTEADNRQNKDIIRIYKAKLCEKMKQSLNTALSEEIKLDIQCEICEEEQGFGEVEKVWITVFDSEISGKALDRFKEEFGLSDEKLSVEYVR